MKLNAHFVNALKNIDRQQTNPLHANITAAAPSHFNQPGHSITDMELNPLESPTLSISHHTGREAYLMDGKILSPDGLNGRNEN